MEFYDRKRELASLEALAKSKKGVLASIYGPRRIGKSMLISKFLEGKTCAYYQATYDSIDSQLKLLSAAVGNAIKNDILAEHGAPDWMSLFRFAAEYSGDKKLFIAIDEFPRLARLMPALPSIMQSAWDQYMSKSNIMLILCGSSISMMKSEVLSYSAPLYGRSSLVIKLEPMHFTEIAQFVSKLKFIDRLYAYFIFGGVPAYYVQAGSHDSFNGMLRRVIDSADTFYSEISLQLSEEVRSDAKFIEVLTLIAEGVNKPSEIASKAHILQSNLYYYLDVLQEIGLVAKEFQFMEEPKMRSKKARYIVKSQFAMFWAIVLRRVRDSAARGDANAYDTALILTESLAQKQFERFGVEFVHAVSNKNIFGFSIDSAGRWWGRDPSKPKDKNMEEIDVVAINESTKDILFAECKWSNAKVGTDLYIELKRKAKLVQWHNDSRKEHYVLFSKSGFTEAMEKVAKEEHVLLFGLKEIEDALQG
ncbi:MAG: ATP-binding protein [Candidatus Micrarchaeaceae archaeon]